jgi:hypothetical protein
MKKPVITVSQSLIKSYLYKEDEIENRCPRKIYVQYVLGLRSEPTIPMMRGLLFEDLCCGTNNNNIELPRHKRNGKKTVAHKRVEEQAHIFKQWLRDRSEGNAVVNEINSQIKIYKRWPIDPDIILSANIDIFPVIIQEIDKDIGEVKYVVSIIDLKFSQDITTTFGKFAWGNIKFMDHTQAIMYLYIVQDIDYDLNDALNPGNNLRGLTKPIKDILDSGLHQFRYYVADSKPNYQAKAYRYILKPGDFTMLNESIRKTVNLIREDNENGWEPVPGPNCNGDMSLGIHKCPFITCKFRKNEMDI